MLALLCSLMLGDPLASLPILNFALLKYSRHVAAYILSVGVEVSTGHATMQHAEPANHKRDLRRESLPGLGRRR